MSAVTTLDSSAAWASATRMVAANRDLLVAIAGVFYVLPWLAGAILVPPLPMAAGLSQVQLLEAIQAYYVASSPVLLPLSFVQIVGMLAMLVMMLDSGRPTVAQAIRQSVFATPSYVAAQLLIAFSVVFFSTGVALFLPDWIAFTFGFGLLLYFSTRTLLIAPIMAAEARLNPVLLIKESLKLTASSMGQILIFIGLASLVFLVVYGLAMMVVSVLLVLMLQGEPQRIVADVADCGLKAVGYTYFVAMLAAIYRQLAGDAAGPAEQ